jgi:hypothetical protein
MNVQAVDGSIDRRDGDQESAPARVLVIFEPGAPGVAALHQAAELGDARTQLTVVALAPQSEQPRCCARGPSVEVVNCVVRDEAERDLRTAREILARRREQVTFKSLVGGQDPPLGDWAAARGFDVIVLPARRLSLAGHPWARRLARATSAELRIVSSR